MSYLAVKHLHMSCAAFSVSLFMLRGMLQLRDKPWRQWRVLRVGPHLIDTVLLGSAVWLSWTLGQYPFVNGWLTAKVLALLLYIVMGRFALAPSTPGNLRLPFFGAALVCVGYIVGVALTHSPTWGLF